MSHQKMSENTSEGNVNNYSKGSKVLYSPAALRDLDRVWTEVFEASASYDITEKYIDELMDKIEEKNIFPDSGSPLYYENQFTGYRFVVYKEYISFYRVERNALLIDRILYRKSDYMQILGFGM